MSLINDALKKAQRERTGEPQSAAPLPGGGPRPPAADSGRPAAFRLQVMLIGGGALLGLVIATGALLYSRRDQPSEPRAQATVAPAPTSSAAEPAKLEPPKSTTPALTVDSTSPASPTSVSVATAPASAQPAPASELPLVTVKTTSPDPAPATIAAAPPAPSTPPAATTKFVEAVEALRVMGIRSSGTDSKVLMNDRVYRVGDLVNHDLGIKLTAVTANSLTFVDANGASYTRNF